MPNDIHEYFEVFQKAMNLYPDQSFTVRPFDSENHIWVISVKGEDGLKSVHYYRAKA